MLVEMIKKTWILSGADKVSTASEAANGGVLALAVAITAVLL